MGAELTGGGMVGVFLFLFFPFSLEICEDMGEMSAGGAGEMSVGGGGEVVDIFALATLSTMQRLPIRWPVIVGEVGEDIVQTPFLIVVM